MSSTEIAAMIAFLMILAVAGVLLLRSSDNGLRMMDRLYTGPRRQRPARR